MVLRTVKHDVLSVLLYYGRIKCACGFEPFASGRHDGVEGKSRPLSKWWSEWNGRNSGESDENHHGNGRCPRRADCKRGYFEHSGNSFPYDRTGHNGKLLSKFLLRVYTGKRIYWSEFGQQSDKRPSRDFQRLACGLAAYTHTNGSLSCRRNRDRCRSGNCRWVVQDEIQLW